MKLQKNFEMRTSGGGGWSVISDIPGRGGEGGVKKGQIFADVLYGWPPIVQNKLDMFFAIDNGKKRRV